MATKRPCNCDIDEDDAEYESEWAWWRKLNGMHEDDPTDIPPDEFYARDNWTYEPDANFTQGILSDLTFNCRSSELCDRCLKIDLEIPLSSLHDLKDGCALCQILKRKIKDTKVPLLKARGYIRICSVLGTQEDSPSSNSIQPGLPVFLQSGSQSHFKLINAWLRLCDEGKCGSSYRGCCPKSYGADMSTSDMPTSDMSTSDMSTSDMSTSDMLAWVLLTRDMPPWVMPTRVIDVGPGEIDHDKVYLISTDKISTDKQEVGEHYVALSHCWGKVPEGGRPAWCTTRNNEKERKSGFLVADLPATFQDAIRVTRELKKRYLWIDSLCIFQDDNEDWETEAKKMDSVFRNAYCTIAATSAKDSTEGFLDRPVERSDSQYVTVPHSSHGKVYVCTSVDDFHGDVEEGVLNKRAWVLQERALSRRIIHFTKRQTYFECGGGVRCETLTLMRNGKASFLSDPEFPFSLRKRHVSTQVKLSQSLFAKYSNSDLTKETDRPVAIHSLATQIARTASTRVCHGMVESVLSRSLLWQRSKNGLTGPIDFAAGKAPPSWSWMSYYGQIEYPEIDYIEIDRKGLNIKDKANNAASNLKNDDYVLEARVRQFRGPGIKPEDLEHIVWDEQDDKVVHKWFDEEKTRCVIIGRGKRLTDGKRTYYVLVVVEGPESGSWLRIGMGSVEQRFILFHGQDVVARIV